jgi:hypothetical protein
MFQVETYLSGVPYKEKRFRGEAEAESYRSELHAAGHYFVDLFDLETASRAQYGTRLDYPLDHPGSRPWGRHARNW